jgi:hypothetical protein
VNPTKSIISFVQVASLFMLSTSTLAAEDLTAVSEQNKREDATTSESDARCFLVALRMKNVDVGFNVALFYWGKLEGQSLGWAKLRDLLSQQNRTLISSDFSPELMRCGKEVEQAGLKIIFMGKDL